jgi:hypothetical protein
MCISFYIIKLTVFFKNDKGQPWKFGNFFMWIIDLCG